MSEIDVTPILDEDCSLLSASRAELGENAGQITWHHHSCPERAPDSESDLVIAEGEDEDE